ncbi:MAG: AmmeMemoRadiSam system protein B [Propionibacteriaceae bacterium]|nr:AmmeMemoRadiSam system protein B [Propionibacteriaceae bacterium]
MRIRPAAVAGMFYPERPEELRAMVDALVADVAAPAPVPKAVIVPHAGYVYSGSTAALAYAGLKPGAGTIRHVVIVGPTHRVGIRAIALPDADALATPLGEVPVWQSGVAALAGLPQVVVSREVHAEEHSLEVQLPFLQRVLPDADVIALAAGWVEPAEVAEVLDALWGGPETLIVISSDLSHYHPYDQARQIDAGTIGQVLALDAGIDHDQACGATGVDGLLLAAPRHGVVPRLLGACNSGDTAGDRRRVVGYAAFGFYGQGDDDDVA